MKDKELRIRMDSDFEQKVEYLKEINGYKNKSDTIRKTVEKEYRKETFEAGKEKKDCPLKEEPKHKGTFDDPLPRPKYEPPKIMLV